MFGIGISELLVILLIAFLVLGPEKALVLSRTIGRLVGDLKRKTEKVEQKVLSELDKINEEEPPSKESEKEGGNHV